MPDHLSGEAGARLYRTGDLARSQPNGLLEFLGRVDHQVKVRGFRIELGEIESVLRADPAIREAVVTTWTAGVDDTRLVAYVVPVESTVAGELWPELQRRLREVLPEYMVPATAEVLPALPLTLNGKVDRAALPAPTWGAGPATAHRAATTPVEHALLGIWREVLDAPDLGVDDDFFDHGGHSLLGTRLLARVRAYFQTEVSTRSLFEASTVAGMAQVVEARETEPGRASAIAELRLAGDVSGK